MVTEGQSASQIMTDVISEAWEGLAQIPSAFSKSDKQIILDVMKMQAELSELADQIPPENATAFNAAVAKEAWVKTLEFLTRTLKDVPAE